MRIENSVTRITVRHHWASLVMPNSYPSNGIFNPHLTPMKDSYSPILYSLLVNSSKTCSETLEHIDNWIQSVIIVLCQINFSKMYTYICCHKMLSHIFLRKRLMQNLRVAVRYIKYLKCMRFVIRYSHPCKLLFFYFSIIYTHECNWLLIISHHAPFAYQLYQNSVYMQFRRGQIRGSRYISPEVYP